MWILSCFCGFHFVVKPLSHTVHVNGFSPVSFMIFSSLCRVSFRVKPFSHITHVNGFFPVGILSCLGSSCFRVKPLSHTAHVNGFSPIQLQVLLSAKIVRLYLRVRNFLLAKAHSIKLILMGETHKICKSRKCLSSFTLCRQTLFSSEIWLKFITQ